MLKRQTCTTRAPVIPPHFVRIFSNDLPKTFSRILFNPWSPVVQSLQWKLGPQAKSELKNCFPGIIVACCQGPTTTVAAGMPLEAFKSVSGALAQPLSILKIGNNCVGKSDGRCAAGSARFPPWMLLLRGWMTAAASSSNGAVGDAAR